MEKQSYEDPGPSKHKAARLESERTGRCPAGFNLALILIPMCPVLFGPKAGCGCTACQPFHVPAAGVESCCGIFSATRAYIDAKSTVDGQVSLRMLVLTTSLRTAPD